MPLGANVYGLGEVVASSGIRRDVGTDGGVGTIQNDWGRPFLISSFPLQLSMLPARDIADPIDQNM